MSESGSVGRYVRRRLRSMVVGLEYASWIRRPCQSLRRSPRSVLCVYIISGIQMCNSRRRVVGNARDTGTRELRTGHERRGQERELCALGICDEKPVGLETKGDLKSLGSGYRVVVSA